MTAKGLKRSADLDSQGGNDASGANKIVLAQVVQGLIQDDCTSLEPYWLLKLDALELLQVLQNSIKGQLSTQLENVCL